MGSVIRCFQYIQELYHGPSMGPEWRQTLCFPSGSMSGPVAFKRKTVGDVAPAPSISPDLFQDGEIEVNNPIFNEDRLMAQSADKDSSASKPSLSAESPGDTETSKLPEDTSEPSPPRPPDSTNWRATVQASARIFILVASQLILL